MAVPSVLRYGAPPPVAVSATPHVPRVIGLPNPSVRATRKLVPGLAVVAACPNSLLLPLLATLPAVLSAVVSGSRLIRPPLAGAIPAVVKAAGRVATAVPLLATKVTLGTRLPVTSRPVSRPMLTAKLTSPVMSENTLMLLPELTSAPVGAPPVGAVAKEQAR